MAIVASYVFPSDQRSYVELTNYTQYARIICFGHEANVLEEFSLADFKRILTGNMLD